MITGVNDRGREIFSNVAGSMKGRSLPMTCRDDGEGAHDRNCRDDCAEIPANYLRG
jgi:hypothetical protein